MSKAQLLEERKHVTIGIDEFYASIFELADTEVGERPSHNSSHNPSHDPNCRLVCDGKRMRRF